MLKNIIGSILIVISCMVVRGEDNVLLWWFNDPVITDFDGSTYKADTLVGRGEAEGLIANGIRISATDSDGNTFYLKLSDTAGEPREFWSSGFGIPDWDNQNYAGPGFADLTGLNLNDTGIQFAMELGCWHFGEGSEVATWVVLASASESIQTMISGGHINASELSYQGDGPWNVTGMSVPEPNSGMLVFIGGMLLALKRKKCV